MSMGTLLMAGLLWSAGTVPIDVFPINQRSFQIPIRIDASRRAEIKELILFASTDQGRTWQQVAVASPDKDSFPYYAPTDGIYWFSVCAVDQHGNREPPDISKVPPGQKILVDTLKPVLRIVSAERQGEDIVVSWEIQEEHPDLATLKLEYRTPDTPAYQWYTAPLSQATSGSTRFRLSTPGSVTIRMQVQDQAGNLATAGTEVSGQASSAGSQVAGTAPAPLPVGPPLGPVSATSPGAPVSPAPSLAPGGPSWETPRSLQGTPASRSDAATSPEPSHSPSSNYQQSSSAAETGRWLVSSDSSPPAAPSSVRAPQEQAPLQMVNSTQVSLDYEVDKVGPSGIGKVELWLTQDDGRTWRKFAEDPDLKPPITVDLPGEGVYGLCLVVQSRAGLGKRPPVSGDPPQMRLEVDTTPPVAKLATPEQDRSRKDALVIRWSVTDKNLDSTPVSLFWSEKADGPWQSIGVELPNTGHYTWTLPPSLPYRVYLRLTAHDKAGNVSEVVTPEPVLVDLNEPEGRIRGIIGGARRP